MTDNGNTRRCRARNKRGERCKSTAAGATGFCVAHDPKREGHMRELGRRSAKARGKPQPDRVPESLRDYLKREVPPAAVWAAIQAALEGGSESARVSASRLLVDALHEPHEQADWREQMRTQMAEAAREFDRKFAERLERHRAIVLDDLRDDREGELSEGDIERLRAELKRLREIERRYLAIPDAIREEHAGQRTR